MHCSTRFEHPCDSDVEEKDGLERTKYRLNQERQLQSSVTSDVIASALGIPTAIIAVAFPPSAATIKSSSRVPSIEVNTFARETFYSFLTSGSRCMPRA